MPKALLDTDIFSELMRDKNEVVRTRARAYQVAETRFTISSITVLEVVKGLHKVHREPEIQRFLASLSMLEVIAVAPWRRPKQAAFMPSSSGPANRLDELIP